MKALLVGLLPTAIVLCGCLFAHLVRRHLAARGEESGVPEEPVPDVTRQEHRDALDAVLAHEAEARTRLARIARREPDLRDLDKRIAPFYLNGAER